MRKSNVEKRDLKIVCDGPSVMRHTTLELREDHPLLVTIHLFYNRLFLIPSFLSLIPFWYLPHRSEPRHTACHTRPIHTSVLLSPPSSYTAPLSHARDPAQYLVLE